MRRRLLISIAVALSGVVSAPPASSAAATTLGVPLPGGNFGIHGAGGGVTFTNTALPSAINASPLDGVVVRFRVQYGDWGNVRLRILRPAGGGMFSAVASSAPESVGTSFDSFVRTFPTRVPIALGDQLGIDADSVGRITESTGGATAYWTPPLTDGDPPSTPIPIGGPNRAYAFNADVEPDADADGFGDESQDGCVGTGGTANGCTSAITIDSLKQKGRKAKVKVTVTVPGAGALSVGSPAALAGAAARRLKTVTRTLTSTAAQQVALTVKLTRPAKRKLRDKGKLKLKVSAVYTPAGGPPASQTKKVKLRR